MKSEDLNLNVAPTPWGTHAHSPHSPACNMGLEENSISVPHPPFANM